MSYTGISGLIQFDEIGDAMRDQAYIKAANTETGSWELVTVPGRGIILARKRETGFRTEGLAGRKPRQVLI